MSERRWPWGERHRVTLPAGPGEHPFQTGRLLAFARNTTRDAVAGLVASVVLIGNIVSFGALMFPGDLGSGVPIAIWAMLIGSCVGGAWIALTTSIPPIATGIDSPTGAFLVLLSAAAGPPGSAAPSRGAQDRSGARHHPGHPAADRQRAADVRVRRSVPARRRPLPHGGPAEGGGR